MKTVVISEFKSRCCELLEQVEKTKESLTVTRRGKALALIQPTSPAKSRKVNIGYMTGQGYVASGIENDRFDSDWSDDALVLETLPPPLHKKRK
jgi:prevent-host-death family protein